MTHAETWMWKHINVRVRDVLKDQSEQKILIKQ